MSTTALFHSSTTLELARSALAQTRARLEELSPGQWTIWAEPASEARFEGRLAGDWLLLDCRLSPGTAELRSLQERRELMWQLVQANPQLPPRVKFALGWNREMQVRAELPVSQAGCVAHLLEQARLGLSLDRATRLDPARPGQETGAATADEPLSESAAVAVMQALDELGWPFVAHDGRPATVGLETDHGSYQARLAGSGQQLRIYVELARWENPSPASCQALAAVLLETSRVVRLARPGVACDRDLMSAFAEVRFADLPSAQDLADGLGALSVTCNLCGQEVGVLEDDQAARQYLAVRGWTDSAVSGQESAVSGQRSAENPTQIINHKS